MYQKIVRKRCLELGELICYQLEILCSLPKKIGAEPPLKVIFLLLIPGIIFSNQNDVEFDFSIGHALVLFLFFMNNKQNM